MDLLKKIKALIARGWASKAEKAEIKAKLKELDGDEQEVVAPEAEQVDALPESEDEANEDETKSLVKGLFADAKDNLEKSIYNKLTADVTKFLNDQKELQEKKAGIYHKDIQAKRKSTNDYLRKFLSATLADDVNALEKIAGISRKELTTDANGSPYGGYAVDSELSAEIRHLMTEYGVFRKESMAVQLSKDSYRANNLVTDCVVYWVDEGDVIGSTEVVLGQKSLELKKLGAIVTLTTELLEEQELDLFGFIAGRVAENLAKAEDLAFFNGDGTSTYGSFTGLLKSTTIGKVTMAGTTFASADADDFLDMQDALPAGAQANAKYYMHRSIRSLVRKLKDPVTGIYIYSRPGEGMPATLWDKPIVDVEAMPTASNTGANKAFVLYGDLKKATIFGYRGAISAKRFDAGLVKSVDGNSDINLITTDREAIRWTEKVGYIEIVPSAVVKLVTATASA